MVNVRCGLRCLTPTTTHQHPHPHPHPPPSWTNDHHIVDDVFTCLLVNEKFCILIKISLKFSSLGSNWQWPSIVLDKSLASNRRQAIFLTNADPIDWHIYMRKRWVDGDGFIIGLQYTVLYNISNCKTMLPLWQLIRQNIGHTSRPDY